MTTQPSNENLLGTLKDYIEILDGDSLDVKKQCYKLLLSMKGSYVNLRRLFEKPEGPHGLDENFLNFCRKVCEETDLYWAVMIVNEYVAEYASNKYDNTRYKHFASTEIPRGLARG